MSNQLYFNYYLSNLFCHDVLKQLLCKDAVLFIIIILLSLYRSKQLIRDAILGNDFTKNYDQSQLKEIVECMYPQSFSNGQMVIKEGDAGSHLFVLAGENHFLC